MGERRDTDPGSETETSPEAASAPSEQNETQARLEELSSKLREEQSRYLRLAADFDNFKKRAHQERQEIRKYAAATVAERLLPVLDDIERAMQRVPEGTDESWLRGLRLTLRSCRTCWRRWAWNRSRPSASPSIPGCTRRSQQWSHRNIQKAPWWRSYGAATESVTESCVPHS